MKPYLGKIETEVGALAVFSRDESKIIKEFKSFGGSIDLEALSSEDCIRLLMRRVTYPISLVSSFEEPLRKHISQEQADMLSQESLNKFADLYIKHHEFLYQKGVTFEKSNVNGLCVSRSEEIVHSIKEDESSFEYLCRLLMIKNESELQRREKFKEIYEEVKSKELLSPHLLSNFEASNAFGKALSSEIERIKETNLREKETTKPRNDVITAQSLYQYETLNSVMKEQSQRESREQNKEQCLESMVDIMSQSSEYMRNIDDNLRQAAVENRKASEEAASIAIDSVGIARTGIRLAIWGIFLNVCVLTLTAFSVWLTWHQSSSGDQVAQSEMQVMAEGFDKLSTSFSELSEIMRKVSQDKVIAEAALQLSEENSVLKMQVLKQSEQIKQLEKEQENILNQLAQISISNEKNTQKTTPSP
ncbi:hypothetical protein D8T49_06535 [Vibrio vulnificus]|uniref:hypothetical protein n=1 Tax=Vibrio vulnificus TaxID=672 RepID=UPI0010233732|nr:hypothetical protein [Vibrio vulnificus]MCU8188320.1 hypothetical protein [Vibrio vulnificus]MCU8196773.1 hypothetical protein [Vibrio vulnificus]MCU8311272.1 hypothetical protein [Vibrio vulnificus]RZQ05917.1 hypothetical protein D8T37_08425 [Vibrio vulnificus]RZQ49686.1 hypothetical protein D8T49_06535 [Vibrio vulnificus]